MDGIISCKFFAANCRGVCDTRLHVILNVYYKKWGIRTEVPTPRVPDLMIDVRNATFEIFKFVFKFARGHFSPQTGFTDILKTVLCAPLP